MRRSLYGPALIDDDDAAPPHRAFRAAAWRRCSAPVSRCWTVAIGALPRPGLGRRSRRWAGSSPRPRSSPSAVRRRAALRYQGAVEQYQWLTAAQMIDGLALGETAPGPLIMVVAFVGFVGGWTHQVLSALRRRRLLAAWWPSSPSCPSFIFILPAAAGRGDARQTRFHRAAERAITAGGRRRDPNLACSLPGTCSGRRAGRPLRMAGGADRGGGRRRAVRFKVGVLPLLGACAIAELNCAPGCRRCRDDAARCPRVARVRGNRHAVGDRDRPRIGRFVCPWRILRFTGLRVEFPYRRRSRAGRHRARCRHVAAGPRGCR